MASALASWSSVMCGVHPVAGFLERVGNHGDTALVVDAFERLVVGESGRNQFVDAERQNMPGCA